MLEPTRAIIHNATQVLPTENTVYAIFEIWGKKHCMRTSIQART